VGRHAELDIDVNRIGVITLDAADRPVNVLGSETVDELLAIVKRLHAMKEVQAVLIRSAKPKQFIAGADIDEIESISDPALGREKAAYGQSLMLAIETLPVPSVAVVDGPCLGGGLELALACTYRVAGDGPHVRLSLPEVRLGIIPGFGGTQRLPRLVGLMAALDLILTGKTLDGTRAFKAGLVDDVAPSEILESVARDLLHRAPRLPLPRKVPPAQKLPLLAPPLRNFVFKKARERAVGETRGFYPAPLAAIDVLEETFGRSKVDGYDLEAQKVGELIASPVSKALIRIFQATESIRKERPPAAPLPVNKVGIVGAGVMGAGIAHLVASRGKPVRLRDVSEGALQKAVDLLDSFGRKDVRRRRLTRREARARARLVSPTTQLSGFGRADLVIEAVVENLEVKRKVFSELSGRTRPDAILATNTSALPVTEIARAVDNPSRVVGLHFFNPVHRMPLVEVIRGEATSEAAVATAASFALAIGKTPIVVKDRPGFLVNRILGIYLSEASLAAQEGVPIPEIEAGLTAFGMPMGPFELMDEVGLDIAEEVGIYLKSAFPHFPPPGALLAELRKEGRLGKKSGKGFYLHEGAKKTYDEPHVAALLRRLSIETGWRMDLGEYGRLLDRFVLLMVNEAARCLEEGIVASSRDVDVGMVFGTGFAPFRGGLTAYANARTLPEVVGILDELEKSHGERFRPAALLRERAASGLPL
jgi:3-hydroxyacyl-CoA dehydrogenase/enoyl-CoA hydratase/3-hydroxybutyryl-CoA epimerase